MDIRHMQPFVDETINTFEVMLGIKPEEKELETKDSTDGTYDISAIIGISGSGAGGIVVSFPEAVACKLVSRMLGEELAGLNQDVTDGIGELVNIIAGNAKRGLVKFGFGNLSLSLPNVVVGKHRTVWRTKDMPCLMKRFFSSDLGPFCIEVNIRASK
ncbi:MAG: chemotaxis protein CheX [Planctomycetota bacterium]|jgi:chemotaxis protein CheX